MTWRPKSGWEVALNDGQLAQLGLVVALEAQAKMAIHLALKAPAKLSHADWISWEKRQLSQLVEELINVATVLDAELLSRANTFKGRMTSAHFLRHRVTHAMWGEDRDHGGAGARDIRRGQMLKPADLTDAIEAMSDLTWAAKKCLERAAELVDDGVLKPGDLATQGPHYKVRGKWIKL